MNRRDIALTAIDGCNPALAADRQGPRGETTVGKRADDDIERDVVAAHDDEVERLLAAVEQRHLRLAVGVQRRRERIDFDKAVGLREAGYRA